MNNRRDTRPLENPTHRSEKIMSILIDFINRHPLLSLQEIVEIELLEKGGDLR